MPSPHQSVLSLQTIGELGGGAGESVVNAAIRSAIRDTEDRGDDGKPRKVTIEIEFRKVGDDHVSTTLKAKTTLPQYVTDATIGAIQLNAKGTAEIAFSPVASDNPDQPPLPDTY